MTSRVGIAEQVVLWLGAFLTASISVLLYYVYTITHSTVDESAPSYRTPASELYNIVQMCDFKPSSPLTALLIESAKYLMLFSFRPAMEIRPSRVM